MPEPFRHVSRSLRADRGLPSLLMVFIGVLLLGAWVTWACKAQIPRYELSDEAHLELSPATYPVGYSQPGQSALHIAAEFTPSAALGKIHQAQPATVRLNGFSLAQDGVVRAQVTKVARELKGGKVNVELAVDNKALSRVPLENGLPASVEIEIERVPPFALVLRSAGEYLGAH